MQRRAFVKGLAVCGLTLTVMPSLVACGAKQAKRFLSAASNHAGEHFIVAFNEAGRLLNQIKIANRGHDLAMLDDMRVAAFSRRPFTDLFIIDLENNQLETTVKAESGYHFYGHGVVDKKRNWLVTTENHIDSAIGYLVVRDATTFNVIKRIKSGGVGPHQCALMPNGKHIVVANGGIKTHPNSGRDKLNLDTMQPNLSYIDLDTGAISETVSPPHFQLSLRHLAVSPLGEVIVGAQYQGHYRDIHPLVFSHKMGGKLTPLAAEKDIWQGFEHYIASVAIANNMVAVTSPRGDKVAYWDLASHSLRQYSRFADCAGVASNNRGFYITNGKGQIKTGMDKQKQGFQLKALKFDNHLIHS